VRFLGYVGQYLLNWLNLLDHMLNCLLLGDADETVSARTARARNAGNRTACVFCQLLTWAQRVITFGTVTRDHCDYALDKSAKPNSREIWNWSQGEIRTQPVSMVDVQENSNS
jgi:hypothetical protein